MAIGALLLGVLITLMRQKAGPPGADTAGAAAPGKATTGTDTAGTDTAPPDEGSR